MLDQGNREIAGFPFYALYLAIGDKVNVYIPADLDQFG